VYRQLLGLDRLMAAGAADGWRVTAIRQRSLLDNESFRARWANFRSVQVVDADADPSSHPANEIWQQVHLPRLLSEWRAEVVYSPAYVGPLRSGETRRVVMMHDDLIWTQPSSYPRSFRLYLGVMGRLCARNAHRVIFPSEDALERCAARLGLRRECCGVTPHGIDLDLFCHAPLEGRDRVAVCVASAERRKNHEVLLRAQRFLRDVPLRLVGFNDGVGRRAGELKAANPEGRWDAIPTASEQDIRGELQRAGVFVLPSRGEGFGFPVIEAMACGTPMVLSDIKVLREVAGDCAA